MSEQRSDDGMESGASDGGSDAGRRADDPWSVQLDALGGFIRAQRQLANLSLREMANLTSVSNAYLSQIERGLHQPSLKVLRSIAEALNLSTEQLLAQTGWGRSNQPRGDNGHREKEQLDTEEAIRRDPRLTDAQREALLGVYRGFLDAGR